MAQRGLVQAVRIPLPFKTLTRHGRGGSFSSSDRLPRLETWEPTWPGSKDWLAGEAAWKSQGRFRKPGAAEAGNRRLDGPERTHFRNSGGIFGLR